MYIPIYYLNHGRILNNGTVSVEYLYLFVYKISLTKTARAKNPEFPFGILVLYVNHLPSAPSVTVIEDTVYIGSFTYLYGNLRYYSSLDYIRFSNYFPYTIPQRVNNLG